MWISALWLCWHGSMLYADAALRDPTEPFHDSGDISQEKAESAVTGYVLEAILVSGADKFAIINNRLVKVGDTVGARQVKKIDTYQVTLAGEGGEIELILFGKPIKKPLKEKAK